MGGGRRRRAEVPRPLAAGREGGGDPPRSRPPRAAACAVFGPHESDVTSGAAVDEINLAIARERKDDVAAMTSAQVVATKAGVQDVATSATEE